MKQRLFFFCLLMCVAGITLCLGQAKPQFGAWGVDLAGRDADVRPGDNFFRYANGAWLDQNPIPSDKAGVSLRLKMTDAVEERLRKILEDAASKAEHQPKDLAGKAGAFYHSFMDET